MFNGTPLLARAKEAISMRGSLILREVESHHHAAADGSRVSSGTLCVASPEKPSVPLLYIGFALQQGMTSLTCTTQGQVTRTWSLRGGDRSAWLALKAELRLVYRDLLPQPVWQSMVSQMSRD